MHFADLWEAVADVVPDRPAVIQGERILEWRAYEDRAARLARAFTDAGLGPDSKIGLFLYNSIEYAEAQFAAFKMRGVPVNVNYRYLDDELHYLLENADAEAIIFHSSLADRIDHVKDRLLRLRLMVEVDDGEGHEIPDATAYEELIAQTNPAPPIARSESDIYMLYTGGTTGMPKGVMYEIGDLAGNILAGAVSGVGADPEKLAPAIAELAAAGRTPVTLPCCPLMHGTGAWLGQFAPHLRGGTMVLLEGRHFDADEVWSAVQAHRVTNMVIVGDAFARPLLRSLEQSFGSDEPYDVSSLRWMLSSGAMFSTAVKDGLFELMPGMRTIDILGSSEGAMADSIGATGQAAETASFKLRDGVTVLDENHNPVAPGSGVVGHVATSSGQIPVGYYKDPDKSARTFPVLDGVRYSIPGDMATVEADGTITLLGRGSHCINTAGEKVFPEEVEEVLKSHTAVDDCLVFGVDDERFGQRVVAVASLAPDARADADDLISHTRAHLAHYKAPKEIAFVKATPRAPNGKADYARARRLLDDEVSRA